MNKQKWFNVASMISLVVVFALSGIALLQSGTEYETMSASGYAFRLEDGSGTQIFAVTDAGNTTAAGTLTGNGACDCDSTLNVDGAATLNSTLDVDGNISSGTGAITMTDAVNITSTLDVDSTLNADGAATLNSTLDVDGNISSGTGAITMTDAVNITSTLDVDSTLNADGATTLNSTLDVDGNISSGTGAVTVTDSLNVTGAVDFDSTLNVDGATTLGGLLYPSFADETITDGETLTPTVTIYALDSAGAVTMTLAATGTEGQLLILIGDDANNITINDTNVRTNDGGVQVIGQYDVITWVYQDSEWIEISESNNS